MKKLLIITAVIGAAVLLCGTRHNPKIAGYEYDTANTLWELSERYCPDNMDKREYIEAVKQLNGMKDDVVHPHVLYQVPIYEK